MRTQDKADIVKKAFPAAHFAIGNLDDYGLLKKQAAEADIVLRQSMVPLCPGLC